MLQGTLVDFPSSQECQLRSRDLVLNPLQVSVTAASADLASVLDAGCLFQLHTTKVLMLLSQLFLCTEDLS